MRRELVMLVAEDDPADADLLRIAMRRAGITNRMFFVRDGEQAIDYLKGHGEFADREKYPFPKVLLTDLKMPRRTGLELLDWLQQHPECKVLPTVLMSGSALPNDIQKAYRFGAKSYFTKPASLDELTELMKVLNEYWSSTELPEINMKCE
jgi:CheY-like chemotaxis protein